MIDLEPFCGKDLTRDYLLKPFSQGDFSYATNGHILVRIPRRDGLPEQRLIGGNKVDFDKPLKGLDAATFTALSHTPLSEIPPPETHECSMCEGRGKDHDCPDFECVCEWCDGSGQEQEVQSTTIRGQILDLKYVRLMLALPGITVAEAVGDEMPLLFKFDGGVGAIMPRRKRAEEHFEIETQSEHVDA